MNAWRRVGCLLLAMMACVAASPENVAKMPKPTAYVDDYAGVMTADGKAQVEAICKEIHQKTKAQIFFVTIKSLDGNTVESFANDLFHNWGIGQKKTDRGVLLLVAVKEHKRRIEVGYGLEGILPDAKAGDIGEDMVPALRTANYDQAALAGVKEVALVIAADSKVTLNTVGEEPAHVDDQTAADMAAANKYENAPPSTFDRVGHWLGMIFPLLFFGFFVFVFLLAFVFRKRVVRRSDGGVGFVDYTPGTSGSSYSSFSGSDSSSSFSSDSGSSSDDSFGGGDGGDSGGGGASGDW